MSITPYSLDRFVPTVCRGLFTLSLDFLDLLQDPARSLLSFINVLK